MARHILSYQFQAAARKALSEGCADGQRVTREALSATLAEQGYTASPEMVEAVVKSGELNTSNQAWDLFRGRYGGIREVDLEATQAEEAAEAERAAKAAAKAAKRAATIAAKKAASVQAEAPAEPTTEAIAS